MYGLNGLYPTIDKCLLMSQTSLDSFTESLDNYVEEAVEHIPLIGEVAVYYKDGELNVIAGENESEEVLLRNIRTCIRLMEYVKRWNSRVYAVKKFNDFIKICVAKEWKSPNGYPKEFENETWLTIMVELDASDDVERLVRGFEAYNSYMKPVPKEVLEKAVGEASHE
jgi:hypothetical protein